VIYFWNNLLRELSKLNGRAKEKSGTLFRLSPLLPPRIDVMRGTFFVRKMANMGFLELPTLFWRMAPRMIKIAGKIR